MREPPGRGHRRSFGAASPCAVLALCVLLHTRPDLNRLSNASSYVRSDPCVGLGQAVRSSASTSVSTTRSISPVVKLVKNGRRIIRLLTESVTGQSKRRVIQA